MTSVPTESNLEKIVSKPGAESGSCGASSEIPLVVDRSFQFAILRRVGMYGVIGASYVGAITLATDCMTDPLANWKSVLTQCVDETVYWVPGLLILVPLVTFNLLRLTRRFALPIDRLSTEMQLLSDGKSESPLELNPNEPWAQLATQFNELRDEILELRQASLLQPAVVPPAPVTDPLDSLPEIEIPDFSKELADAMSPPT